MSSTTSTAISLLIDYFYGRYVFVPLQVSLALQSSAATPTPAMAQVFWISDIAFNAVFILECAAKVVALGLYSTGTSSYLRNAWNVADFVLLIGSVLCT